MATSKNKAISISKFDVDPEGEHLNMIIDCPSDYKFTSLIITAYSALHGIKSAVTANFDGSLAVFGDDSTQPGDHYDIIIALDFNRDTNTKQIPPSIYRVYLKAESTQNNGDDPLEDYAYTSDLRHVYDCMVSDILNQDPCQTLPDSIIRSEVLLQGHLYALKSGNIEVALQYFLKLNDCFGPCPVSDLPYQPSKCGCGK